MKVMGSKMEFVMKILKKYGLMLTVVLMGQSTVHGLFDYKQYKGLLTIFNEENKELSPVYGALAYASDFLENIYNWAPDQWPTYALAHKLFNILEINGRQEGRLHVSVKPLNIGRSFDGKIIGEIVVWLRNGQLENIPEKLTKTIVEKHWQAKSSEGATVEVLKKIAKKKKDHCQEVRAYLRVIAESYNFDSKVTLMMLTAVLYLKQSIEKQEMMDYLTALQDGLSDVIFVKPLTEELKSSILEQIYTSEELRIGGTQELEVVGAILNDYFFPPAVVSGSYGFRGQLPVSNCVEAALNDWFNLLLYDSNKGLFDLKLLPEAIQSSLSPAFRLFYETYTVEGINSNKARQAFMDMVSALEGVVYVGGKDYEIDAMSDNILAVINILLGTKATSWNDLCAMLSTEKRIITKIVLPSEKDNVRIEIDNKSENKVDFVLKINYKAHVSLECEARDRVEKYNMSNNIGQANKHYFFAYDIKNKYRGAKLVWAILQMEVRLEILQNLLKKNYCVDDINLIKILFLNTFNYQRISELLYNKSCDAFLEYLRSSENIDVIICFLENAMFFLKNRDGFCEGELAFYEKFVQMLPENLFALYNKKNVTILGSILLAQCYTLAELCIRKWGDKAVFSVSDNDVKDVFVNLVSDYFNADAVVRERVRLLLSCPALSYDVLKGENIYPLDGCLLFSKFMRKALILSDENRLESFNFLLQLISDGVVEVNTIQHTGDGIHKTALDNMINSERLNVAMMKKNIKIRETEALGFFANKLQKFQEFLMYAIERLHEVGAKTAVELEEKAA